MGLLDRFDFGRRRAEKAALAEARSLLLESVLKSIGDRGTTVVRDRSTALGVNIVFACVSRISGTISSCPLHLYRKLKDGGKELATDHPLYFLLNAQPSPIQTAADFRVAMQTNVELMGNAFARIYRNKADGISYIEPLNVMGYKITVDPDPLKYPTYELTVINGKDNQSQTVFYNGKDLLHLKGITFDGIGGLNTITVAQDSLNLAAKITRSAVSFYENGCRPSMVAKFPNPLGADGIKNLKSSIEAIHRGEKNAYKLIVLEDGGDIKPLQNTNVEADTVAFRLSIAEDICRIFGIPPHKVGILERSTNNNIEQQAIEYTSDCILPRIVRWENELNSKLLQPTERETYFFQFDLDSIKRGDTQSRYTAYAAALNNGWMSVNEVRAKENMNPIDGGDVYRFPLNTAPVGEDLPNNNDANEPQETPTDEQDDPKGKKKKAPKVDPQDEPQN